MKSRLFRRKHKKTRATASGSCHWKVKLYLKGNRTFTELPPAFIRLQKLIELQIDTSGLKIPPKKIADQGPDSIRKYFASTMNK